MVISWESFITTINYTRISNLLAFKGSSVCLSSERPDRLLSVYYMRHTNTHVSPDCGSPDGRSAPMVWRGSRGGPVSLRGSSAWLVALQKRNYASSKTRKPDHSQHRPLRDSAELTTKTSHFIPATLGTCRVHRCPFKILWFFHFYCTSFCFRFDLTEMSSDVVGWDLPPIYYLFLAGNFCVSWDLSVRSRVGHQLGFEHPRRVGEFIFIYRRGNWDSEKLVGGRARMWPQACLAPKPLSSTVLSFSEEYLKGKRRGVPTLNVYLKI